jgi:hypothetical protein
MTDLDNNGLYCVESRVGWASFITGGGFCLPVSASMVISGDLNIA